MYECFYLTYSIFFLHVDLFSYFVHPIHGLEMCLFTWNIRDQSIDVSEGLNLWYQIHGDFHVRGNTPLKVIFVISSFEANSAIVVV